MSVVRSGHSILQSISFRVVSIQCRDSVSPIAMFGSDEMISELDAISGCMPNSIRDITKNLDLFLWAEGRKLSMNLPPRSSRSSDES